MINESGSVRYIGEPPWTRPGLGDAVTIATAGGSTTKSDDKYDGRSVTVIDYKWPLATTQSLQYLQPFPQQWYQQKTANSKCEKFQQQQTVTTVTRAISATTASGTTQWHQVV